MALGMAPGVAPGQGHRARAAPPHGWRPPSASAAKQRGGKARSASGGSYFKLIVVFTPWLVVLSSNQRAVTVLVWV